MEASERSVAIERMVWGSGCPMIALRETQRLAAQARDPVTVDFQLPPLTSNMAAAAYPSSCDNSCVYHHMQQVTFGDSTSALPPYNPIEVINYFVTVEHENELARYSINTQTSFIMFTALLHHVHRQRVVTPPPPPPPEPEDELPHNTVIALPKINK